MYDFVLEIHCGVLKTPSRGSRHGNSDVVNSTVKFSCDHGFRLEGSVQRNCTDEGTWDGVDTTCIGQSNYLTCVYFVFFLNNK